MFLSQHCKLRLFPGFLDIVILLRPNMSVLAKQIIAPYLISLHQQMGANSSEYLLWQNSSDFLCTFLGLIH